MLRFRTLSASLDLPEATETPINPFVLVTDAFRGTRRFADVITWNIEYLHIEMSSKRLRNVARLIRDIRCDS